MEEQYWRELANPGSSRKNHQNERRSTILLAEYIEFTSVLGQSSGTLILLLLYIHNREVNYDWDPQE